MEVSSSLARLLSDQIGHHELQPSEFEVLLRLSRSPGGRLRMNDLARQIVLSSSGLTRLADRLEGRGLLVRRPCPDDGRGSDAHITAPGRELILEALPDHLALVDQWFTSALPPKELDALLEGLRQVRARVHPDADLDSDASPPS